METILTEAVHDAAKRVAAGESVPPPPKRDSCPTANWLKAHGYVVEDAQMNAAGTKKAFVLVNMRTGEREELKTPVLRERGDGEMLAWIRALREARRRVVAKSKRRK